MFSKIRLFDCLMVIWREKKEINNYTQAHTHRHTQTHTHTYIYIYVYIYTYTYIYIYIYIYNISRSTCSSYPGLISVAPVNDYRTIDVTSMLKISGVVTVSKCSIKRTLCYT